MPNSSEDKMSKFERLAERRVSDALKKLTSIGKLANTNNYEYNKQHVEQILDALDTKVTDLRKIFQGGRQKAASFKFNNVDDNE